MAGEKCIGMASSNVMSVGNGENGTWVHISTPDNSLVSKNQVQTQASDF